MSDEFITTEDYLNANRSPQLQPTHPNFQSIETPPPLDDSDDNYDSDVTETKGEGVRVCGVKPSKGRPQPSLCDSLLMKLLGPNYPEVALKAGTELFTLSPEKACEDCRPSATAQTTRMLGSTLHRAPSGTADEKLARAAFEASEKLNAAINNDGRAVHTANIAQSRLDKHYTTVHVHEIEAETVDILSNRYQQSLGINNTMVSHLSSSGLSSPKFLNVKPPPKVSLPAIRTGNTNSRTDWTGNSNDSIATSPALAKFTITPAHGNPQQQLPKMQTAPPQSLAGLSPGRNQTLPSLETALKQIPDTDGAPYSAHSSAISRPSPAQYSQFGPSPSSCSNHSPASAISPPRLPAPYWRTTSHETSSSTPSEQASTVPSAGISTPASSYYARSPSNSVSTPATIVPDSDNASAVSASSSAQLTDGSNSYNAMYGNGSFKCTFPGCNALPFQTQYLLNSHANVHSNTRNHFCPVQGCPRGPGGQGFKRKNEMIRHGLVHQSPGYVCPFCPDQQHKYPRPDNLQRHVRVHHVDKDRDHPLLREVLAQRPEGGNRGRRRRLGS